MGKKYLLLFIVIVNVTFTINASLTNSSLYSFQSEHFIFVFAETTRDAAYFIASFAESYYSEFAKCYNSSVKDKITVILSIDTDMSNGLTFPLGYPVILIFTAPPSPDSSIGNSDNWLKMVFIHELSHAFFLNMKTPFIQILSDIFGNFFLRNALLPEFMIEGTAVYDESKDGYGRVYDPLITEQLLQDIAENKFKNPAQASGSYDNYMSGNIPYWYGGLFQSYLISVYGIDKYWSFLQSIKGSIFSCAFYSAFDIDIFTAWNNFKDFIAYKGSFVDATEKITQSDQSINLVTAGSKNPALIVYNDSLNKKLYTYSSRTGKSSLLVDYNGTIQSISLSQDETKLLVTYINYESLSYKSYTKVFNMITKQFEQNVYSGFLEAGFFGDTIIGVKVRNNSHDLVMAENNGTCTILLKGWEGSTIASPQYFNKDTVVFLLQIKGKKLIAYLNINTKKLITADIPLKYMRNIFVFNETIYFSYNNDYTFYKLAYLKNSNLFYQINNIEGGFHNPVVCDNSLFLISYYSDYKTLQKVSNIDAIEFKNSVITFTNLNIPDDESKSQKNDLVYNGKEQVFSNFSYILPDFMFLYFRFINLKQNNFVFAYGLQFYGIDPLNLYPYSYLFAYVDTVHFFTMDIIHTISVFSPSDMAIQYVDDVKLNISSDLLFRYQSLSLKTNFIFNLSAFDGYLYIQFYSALSSIYRQADDIQIYAYDWQQNSLNFENSLTIGYATVTKLKDPLFYKGFLLECSIDTGYNVNLKSFFYGFSSHIAYYIPNIPIQIHLYGAFSPYNEYTLSYSNRKNIMYHFPDFMEYHAITIYDTILFASDSKLCLFSLEIQQGLWLAPLYFNRLYSILGYRNAYLANTYFHSLYFDLILDMNIWYGFFKTKCIVSYIYPINTGESQYTILISMAF